jgi:hypothetical protein
VKVRGEVLMPTDDVVERARHTAQAYVYIVLNWKSFGSFPTLL